MSRIAQILVEEGLVPDGRTAAAMYLYAAPFLEGYFYLFADDKDTVIHRGYKARLAEEEIKAEASKLWKGKSILQIMSLYDFQKRFNAGKKASMEPDFRDLEMVFKGLGDIKFLRYSPGSGSLQATIAPHIGDSEVMISGKLDGSELVFDAAISRKVKGYKLEVPYEDHEDAVRELRRLLSL